jgi:serine/threonine-protein kinase
VTGAGLQHPRYRFDRWIAAGGMGEVWQATDTLLEREVAVKVLRRDLGQDPVLRARFEAEARHAGSLQHRNVASVLDYGEITVDGQPPLPFLVMELVEGQSLSALMAGGPLAPELAADLIAQAADGLEAAHGLGIVHRDVKPGNLLVTPAGQVKVTDFGVARAADAAPLTLTGHLVGTPHYLSPEQAEGASATAVSDVYALGIVLFECLVGRKPFAGESPVATALMQIREPLPPFPPEVPERLQRITVVATAKVPGERFRTAGAMAAALRDESPDTRTFLVPQRDIVQTGEAGPSRPAEAGRGRLRGRPVLAGLTALLLTAGGVWALTAADDPPSSGAAPTENVQQLGAPVVLSKRSDPPALTAPAASPSSPDRTGPGTSRPSGHGPRTEPAKVTQKAGPKKPSKGHVGKGKAMGHGKGKHKGSGGGSGSRAKPGKGGKR